MPSSANVAGDSLAPFAPNRADRAARPGAIAIWLFALAGLVFAMVVVGGITRLTESGLSITQWNVVTGILPPLTDAQWQTEFALYKQTTEYQTVNFGMSLGAFKSIFFWEYLHRLLGRLIGFAFALPLAWFALRRAIPTGYGWRLVALFALGGLQGAIGWWMVVSGLVGRTDVSHYRLAVHLLNALIIMSGLIWTALDLRQLARNPAARPARLTRLGIVVLAILFVQLLFGAWVAGLNAGYVANSWPLMNSSIVPDGIDWSHGVLAAFSSDPFLVHFIHRWWAWVVVAALLYLARQIRRSHRKISVAIHAAFGTQILLGIATVMSGVNIYLAGLHQAVGALLVAAAIFGVHALGRPARETA